MRSAVPPSQSGGTEPFLNLPADIFSSSDPRRSRSEPIRRFVPTEIVDGRSLFSRIVRQIGRASCREREWIGVGGVGLKKNEKRRSKTGGRGGDRRPKG